MKLQHVFKILMFVGAVILSGCSGGHVASDNTKNVLMITDIHFDPFNSCGTSVTPDSEQCVMKLITESNPALWKFPKLSLNQFGQETNNDFLNRGLNNLSKIIQQYNINTIFVTGDLLSHKFPDQFASYVPSGTQAEQTALALNTINYVLYRINQSVSNAKIYYIFGNNDTDQSDYSYPTNSFMQKISPIVAQYSENPQNIFATFSAGGYYVMPYNDTTDVIALNFNPLTVENQGNSQDLLVAESQLIWLKKQLSIERSNNKKVIILQHEPFGMNMFNIAELTNPTNNLVKDLQDAYLLVYNEYNDIITNYYYGHYHMEDLQVGAGILGLSSLGFSVDFNNNPGFKILQLNNLGQLQNFTSYSTAYQNNQLLEWHKLYEFNQAYGISSYDYVNYFRNILQPNANSDGWSTYVKYYSGNNTSVSVSKMPIIDQQY